MHPNDHPILHIHDIPTASLPFGIVDIHRDDFIQNSFVDDGMCADVAIHDPDPPGHNPHAHILVTVHPLDEQGKWQHKTEKEYLCVKNGEEQGFTAAEFKTAQADRWEKQYPYKIGRKKV